MIGAIVDMVNYQYEINKRGNISSESIDDYRVVFDTTIPSHITSTFSKYKRLYV